MAVPLQPLKRYGEALKTLLEMKNHGELKNADGSNGIRLCYIDPPFATKREFRGGSGQRAYRDKIAGAQFVEYLRRRLVFISEILSEDGALYMHLDWKKAHYMKIVLDEVFGEGNFRNELIWHYKFRLMPSDRIFNRKHDTILFYAKSKQTWLRDVSEEWTREAIIKTRKQAIYTDDEGKEWIWMPGGKGHSKNKKKYLDEIVAEGKALSDVWDMPIISSSAKERTGYPTQKPEALIERIIRASTDEGDLVLDCFSGSGTTAAVAERLGRRWICNDSGKLAIYVTQRRLLSGKVPSDPAEGDAQPKPFDLCTAGMYDNSLLEGLDFDSYTRFCLDLFECRKEQFKIGGITFAGRRKGEPVHLFPFNLAPELQMGVDYLESLHERLKGKVSGAVFVIVPITHCDPGLFADVVPTGKILFFVLRVPYSAIEALHGRPFKVLDQPFSAADLNDPVDTFGFDFVQLPEVDVRYVKNGPNLHVVINAFKRGGLDPDDFDALEEKGRLDLAMVMVDRHYDGEVFRVSDYFFGDQLEDNGWTFALPLKGAGAHFFFVFMDTHGNELREPIKIATVQTGSKPRVKKPKVKSARSAEEIEAEDTVDETLEDLDGVAASG
jgi:DNA modification methylase